MTLDHEPPDGDPPEETLDERIGVVLEELETVASARDGAGTVLSVRDRPFAVVSEDALELALDPPVARAALSTPDTRPSDRGPGWIRFAPKVADRYALDRAEAWLRSAHRRAEGASRGN